MEEIERLSQMDANLFAKEDLLQALQRVSPYLSLHDVSEGLETAYRLIYPTKSSSASG